MAGDLASTTLAVAPEQSASCQSGHVPFRSIPDGGGRVLSPILEHDARQNREGLRFRPPRQIRAPASGLGHSLSLQRDVEFSILVANVPLPGFWTLILTPLCGSSAAQRSPILEMCHPTSSSTQ